MKRFATAVGMLVWLSASSAIAQDGAATSLRSTNPLIDALGACLAEHDDPQRLACLDAAARRLVSAEREHDVVVVDRDEVKKTRRSLFGLNLGVKDVFAGRDKPADRITKLDTTLVAAREIGGRWSLALAEGGRWQTAEAWTLTGNLAPGMSVSIHPGALGSYIARVGNQRAVRVQRVN